jgi:hypothetical protein
MVKARIVTVEVRGSGCPEEREDLLEAYEIAHALMRAHQNWRADSGSSMEFARK